MAEWNGNPSWTSKEQINGGKQFDGDSIPTPEEFNALVENVQYLYSQGGNFEVNPYPVGAIFMSVDPTSPAYLFGGSWERIQDKFLLASGTTYEAGSSGGSADSVIVAHSHALDRSALAATGTVDTSFAVKFSNASAYGAISMDLSTSSVGVSGVGKNMPPYLTVYMWKRIS